MRQIEERIMERLNELVNPNIEAIDVKIFGTKSGKSIEIIIESDNGISLDDCAETSNIVKNFIKLEHMLEDDFNIQVSSPGINRPLFNLKDFIKYQGEKVFLELKRNLNNQKRFTGEYYIENELIILSDKKQTIKISMSDIKKANLIKEIKI